jgi:plastocyanin
MTAMFNELSTIIFSILISIAIGFMPMPAKAFTLSGTVTDKEGHPVADAVVSAFPAAKDKPAPKPGKLDQIELDQQGKEFIPHVLVIHTGSQVVFPNTDNIQHHVYSFSAAKPFEIKLYKGTPAAPEVFNQPGVVVLGCNIHDWMLAYIYVTDAPYFNKTDDKGHWQLELPDGEYRLSFWQPDAVDANSLPNEVVKVPIDHALQEIIDIKSQHPTGKPAKSSQTPGYLNEF